MKTRYIIILDENEEPVCVSKERTPGTVSVLIIARTSEEARCLFDQHKTK